MKKTRTLLFIQLSLLLLANVAFAQDENPLEVSGSVDLYYKYDFSGNANIGTSFADQQNSLSIGMVDLLLQKTVGKASFTAELAFGPRNAASAGPGVFGDDNASVFEPHIQNLNISYALSDQVSITAGYMGTFVGYEIISPTGNFNYSTSYLFTNGPFQNAGVKLDVAPTDNFAFMVGVFNQWNVYQASPGQGLNNVGAQIYVSPVEGWDAYLNFTTELNGENTPGNTEVDLTTTFQVDDKLLLGLNAAVFTDGVDEDSERNSFAGAAAYLNYSVSDPFALGLRYEYFSESEASGILLGGVETNVNAFTLSANLTHGPLTFIPELRLDAASEEIFVDGDSDPSKTAVQAVLAAVFAF